MTDSARVQPDVLLTIDGLRTWFDSDEGVVKAVAGVSFAVRRGKPLGVVGESGCGKSTTGRTILRLLDATSGEMLFRSEDSYVDLVAVRDRQAMKQVRRRMQIIFRCGPQWPQFGCIACRYDLPVVGRHSRTFAARA